MTGLYLNSKVMDIYPPPAHVSETSAYQKMILPLRSKQTPDKDVVMLSPSPKHGSQPPNRPVFSSDDFIPFSRMLASSKQISTSHTGTHLRNVPLHNRYTFHYLYLLLYYPFSSSPSRKIVYQSRHNKNPHQNIS